MGDGERIVGHGVDLVEIDRIAALLERHGDQFKRRCFTDGEQAYADAGRKRRAERYAARFACKEAVLKALGTGWRDGIGWTDIAVVNEPSGRPLLRLSGRCLEIARALGADRWVVSLSHAGPARNGTSGGYAMASVIAIGGSSPDVSEPAGTDGG